MNVDKIDAVDRYFVLFEWDSLFSPNRSADKFKADNLHNNNSNNINNIVNKNNNNILDTVNNESRR